MSELQFEMDLYNDELAKVVEEINQTSTFALLIISDNLETMFHTCFARGMWRYTRYVRDDHDIYRAMSSCSSNDKPHLSTDFSHAIWFHQDFLLHISDGCVYKPMREPLELMLRPSLIRYRHNEAIQWGNVVISLSHKQ